MNPSIHEYLASLDPFRLAHPLTPLPWPRDEAPAPQPISEIFQSLLPSIINFLTTQGLSIVAIKLTRQHRITSDMRDTVSISTDSDNTTAWSKMIESVYNMFPLAQRSTLQIEIENPCLACRPSNVCGVIDEEALSSYLSITSSLRDFVIECPAQIFLGFGFFLRRQRANSVPKPTVVVHVHEEAKYDWRALDTFLSRITISTKLDFEIRPAIAEEKAFLDQLYSDPTEERFPLKPYNGAAINGVGISPTNVCKLGTLGGSVVLRPKERVRSTGSGVEQSQLIGSRPGQNPTDLNSYFCVMTNHHVVQSDNNDSHFRTGFEFNPESPTGPIIRYPCDAQYSAYMSRIGKLVEKDASTYGPMLLALEERDAKRDLGRVLVSSGGTARTIDCSRNEHNDCTDQDCKLCISKTSVLNKFPCGNWNCTGQHRIQDWAAIKIPIEMMFVNEPPPCDQIDQDRLPRGKEYKPSITINEIADLELGSYVIKKGARTGVTCGQVVPQYHRVRQSNDFGPPGTSKRYLTFFELHSAVIGVEDPDSVEEEPPSFSKKGDSGAWIVDLEGRLVGLLHSGINDSAGKSIASFVSPIKEVFAQLEQKTDCHVDLPTAVTAKRSWTDVLLNRRPITVSIQA